MDLSCWIYGPRLHFTWILHKFSNRVSEGVANLTQKGFLFLEVFYNKTVSTFLFNETTAITLTNMHAGCAYLAVLQAVLPCSVSTFSRFSTKRLLWPQIMSTKQEKWWIKHLDRSSPASAIITLHLFTHFGHRSHQKPSMLESTWLTGLQYAQMVRFCPLRWLWKMLPPRLLQRNSNVSRWVRPGRLPNPLK